MRALLRLAIPAVTLIWFSPAAAATFLPDFSAATFTPGAAISNPYLTIGPSLHQTLSASGTDKNGPFTETSVRSYAGAGKTLLGVATQTLLDQAYVNGVLKEETRDYFAQDTAGNVWYMGEDVVNYVYDAMGNLTGTTNASSWLSGINGALPGWVMPATLSVGQSFFQEFAPNDQALDTATVLATDATVKSGGKTYSDVVVMFETSLSDPDLRELKYYAPGVGLIREDEAVDLTYDNPDLIFTLGEDPAPVPLPAGLPMLAGALAGLAVVRRRVRGGLGVLSGGLAIT